MTNGVEIKDQAFFSNPLEFYADQLENKIKEAWLLRIRPVLLGISNSKSPTENDISLAFEFLTAVKAELNNREHDKVALTDICDMMYDNGLCVQKNEDRDRTDGLQLVFAAVGWLSMCDRFQYRHPL